MKRILFPVDIDHVDRSIINFACYIAEMAESSLSLISTDSAASQRREIEHSAALPFDEQKEYLKIIVSEDRQELEAGNLDIFEEICTKRGIRYEITGLPVEQVARESRFSDLMIVDPRMKALTTSEYPSKFVERLLLKSECPVMVAPLSYSEINEVIHCYDGSSSALYAIKQFTYLFPALCELKCLLLQVNSGKEADIKEEYEMKKWLKAHYQQCGFEVLHGNLENALTEYLDRQSKSDAIFTMGAYGRTEISNLIRESRANTIIRKSNFPLFIAHRPAQ